MSDEKKKNEVVNLVSVYAGLGEHVADMPQERFEQLKDDGHPVYAYPTPKPVNN